MIIKNVKVYTEEKTFSDGIIYIKDGVFDKIIISETSPVNVDSLRNLEGDLDEVIDGRGAMLSRG